MLLLQNLCDYYTVVVDGCLKANLPRIAHKIKEIEIDQDQENLIDKNTQKAFRISDMSKATITVEFPNQIQQIYEAISGDMRFTIVKIKNNLNSDSLSITLNVVILNKMIGEIQI